MELCGSLLLFLALLPEAGPEAGPEGVAGAEDGDPVAAEAVMISSISSLSLFLCLECCSFETGLFEVRVEGLVTSPTFTGGGGNVKTNVQ